MVNRFFSQRGFTLIELLIVIALLGLVFAGAISMYTSALKFLGMQQSIDVSSSPEVALEQIAKKAVLANAVLMTQGGTQLNLRLDQDCSGGALNTPSVFTGDAVWHYRLLNNQLLGLCNTTWPDTTLTAPNSPAGTSAVLSNLNTSSSTLQLTNPSAEGSATVVSLHIVSTTPSITVDTETALGATAKR